MAISVSRRTAAFALVALLASVAWWFWPTDTRAVAGAIDHLRSSAAAGDWEAFMTGVSRRYAHEGVTYGDLCEMGESLATMLGPCNVIVFRKRIKVQGNLATASVAFGAMASSGSSDRLQGAGRMVWQITFRKERGRWLVTKASPISMPGYLDRRVNTVKDLRRWLGI